MGWPEALVAVIVSANGVLLAWLTMRQQQVKRALNGHQDYVTSELQALGRLVRDSDPRRPRRVPGVLPDERTPPSSA